MLWMWRSCTWYTLLIGSRLRKIFLLRGENGMGILELKCYDNGQDDTKWKRFHPPINRNDTNKFSGWSWNDHNQVISLQNMNIATKAKLRRIWSRTSFLQFYSFFSVFLNILQSCRLFKSNKMKIFSLNLLFMDLLMHLRRLFALWFDVCIYIFGPAATAIPKWTNGQVI